MADFLTLCKRLRSIAGISGTGPASVTDTNTMYDRVIYWINESNKQIQQHSPNWKFMWTRTEMTVNESSPGVFDRDLDTSSTAIKSVDKDSFTCYDPDIGEAGEWRLTYVDYEVFRSRFDLGVVTPGRPSYITQTHTGDLRLYPTPDTDYRVQFEYYRKAQTLAANTDIPLIPEEYHTMIVNRALVNYAIFENATIEYQGYEKEYLQQLANLERDYIPEAVVPIIPFA